MRMSQLPFRRTAHPSSSPAWGTTPTTPTAARAPPGVAAAPRSFSSHPAIGRGFRRFPEPHPIEAYHPSRISVLSLLASAKHPHGLLRTGSRRPLLTTKPTAPHHIAHTIRRRRVLPCHMRPVAPSRPSTAGG